MNREFDIVLYGVSGFVGELLAEYLANTAEQPRIALAGRDPERVASVRASLPSAAREWEILHADANDETSLRRMAERSRVVVSTVGPYATYGLPLVRACAEAGTDYADLTGEPLFVRDSIAAAHERAKANSAKIVHSCGYDSVPSDLNVYLTHQRALAEDAGNLTESTQVAMLNGRFSGGTIATAREQLRALAEDPGSRASVRDPYLLSPDRSNEADASGQSDVALGRAADIDPTLSGWVTSFVMAPHNTRIVRRSNALLDWAYGKDLRYREVMRVGDSRAAPALAAGLAGALWLKDAVGPTVEKLASGMIDRVAPKPGTGPDAETRKNGHFTSRTISRTTGGATYRTTFAAQGDPGYFATSVILGETALCLVRDRERLDERFGVLTPATVLATPLAERLRAQGMTINVERI